MSIKFGDKTMRKSHTIRMFDAAALWLVAIFTSIALGGCATSSQHAESRQTGLSARATGEIYANCDNAFVLYVNDQEVLRNANWEVTPPPVPVSLRPGDVIKVRASDFGGGYGFAFLYCSRNKTAYFSANTNNWYTYTPPNEVLWWKVPNLDALKLAHASEGNMKVVAAEIEFKADAPCKSDIWGEIGEPTAFLLHEVTSSDLKARNHL
jgi:hypothetical protein